MGSFARGSQVDNVAHKLARRYPDNIFGTILVPTSPTNNYAGTQTLDHCNVESKTPSGNRDRNEWMSLLWLR